MCGLFGGASVSLSSIEKEDIISLGIVSSLRGVHSTGICVAKNSKKKHQFYIRKEPCPSQIFFGLPKVNDLLKTNDIIFINGHCRHATIGEIKRENAHPFIKKGIIGVHNGTILSLGSKDKTDSEELYEKIEELGPVEALKKHGKGAYALVFNDVNKRTLYFIRNSQRTLFYMFDSMEKTILWASEKEMLDLISKRSKKLWKDPVAFEAGRLYTLKVGSTPSLKEEKVDVTPEYKYSHDYSHYWSSHNSHSYRPSPSSRRKKVSIKLSPIADQYKGMRKGPSKVLHYPFREPSNDTNDNDEDLLSYTGYLNEPMTVWQAKRRLRDGCSICHSVPSLEDSVLWIEKNVFLCDSCNTETTLKTFNLEKRASSLSTYKKGGIDV